MAGLVFKNKGFLEFHNGKVTCIDVSIWKVIWGYVIWKFKKESLTYINQVL
jgi:hypothetical protein